MSDPKANTNSVGRWGKTYNGILLVTGNVYNINGEFLVYAGDYSTSEEVPTYICCFTIGDELRVRRSTPSATGNREKNRRKRADDDKPIDTTIKDTDNSLMVMIKIGLNHKGITRGDFKNAYNSDSDMNNALRCIEDGDNLSWTRFNDLCQRFNLSYNLELFDGVDRIEQIDSKR